MASAALSSSDLVASKIEVTLGNFVYKSNITACVILVCTVDNLFQEFKIQGSELITYQNLFLGRLKKFNEMNNLG